jgi:hypothetical protein
MEYEFEFRFKLPAQDADAGALVERLGAAGCEDALIGVGQPGRIALQFTREADSAKQAILSALEDVKKVIPGAELIEAGPDFVGLTDVAHMAMQVNLVREVGRLELPIQDQIRKLVA